MLGRVDTGTDPRCSLRPGRHRHQHHHTTTQFATTIFGCRYLVRRLAEYRQPNIDIFGCRYLVRGNAGAGLAEGRGGGWRRRGGISAADQPRRQATGRGRSLASLAWSLGVSARRQETSQETGLGWSGGPAETPSRRPAAPPPAGRRHQPDAKPRSRRNGGRQSVGSLGDRL